MAVACYLVAVATAPKKRESATELTPHDSFWEQVPRAAGRGAHTGNASRAPTILKQAMLSSARSPVTSRARSLTSHALTSGAAGAGECAPFCEGLGGIEKDLCGWTNCVGCTACRRQEAGGEQQFVHAITTTAHDREGKHEVPRNFSISHKMYFEHNHKCAGSSLRDDIKTVVTPCEPALACCSTYKRPGEIQRLKKWWFSESAGCQFHTNEDHLAQLLRYVYPRGVDLAAQNRLGAEQIYGPVLLSMYRHPIERCRSAFNYDLQICTPLGCRAGPQRPPQHGTSSQLSGKRPGDPGYKETFCAYQQRNFPDNRTGHVAYAHEACREQFSGQYNQSMGLQTAQHVYEWIVRNVIFWGLADYYQASFCLFLYQAGHRRFDECSCDRRGSDMWLHHDNTERPQKEFVLGMSDDELAALNGRDLTLYDLLHDTFLQRVRYVERQTGRNLLCESAVSASGRRARRSAERSAGAVAAGVAVSG